MMKLFIRIRMRRAYNKCKWHEARNLALTLLHHNREANLAKSIIIRTYWNEKNYLKAKDLVDEWGFEGVFPKIDQFFENNINSAGYKITCDIEHEWDPHNLISNFHQIENRLWLKTPLDWIYWEMPEGFSLGETHNSLLLLATEVLLKPWIGTTSDKNLKAREYGARYSLSFSGGIDSTAAMILLPEDTVLAYHQRDFNSQLRHDNAKQLFDYLQTREKREIFIVKSNHEIIRTSYGKKNGFSTDYAAGVHLILLSDFLNLKGIAFGLLIDNIWLEKGHKFRDFSESAHWLYWSSRFREAGLELVLPINMISEAGAMKICQTSELIKYTNSCLRGNQDSCGKCWKCFHKNGPLGREIDYESKEIQVFLKKRPLRTAMHALWAIQKMNLEYLVPDMSELLEKNLCWWEKIYTPGIELLPDDLKEIIYTNLKLYLVEMSEHQSLMSTNLFPDY